MRNSRVPNVIAVVMLLSGLFIVNASAQPWRPGFCSPTTTKNWAAFEKSVRQARPDSVIYAPVPYPQTAVDVLKDFEYAYAHLRNSLTSSDLPAGERPFYDRFMAGRLSARIEKVQNWSPTRCLPESRHDFYYLLILSDITTGEEVGRFALRQSGLWSQFSPAPAQKAGAAAQSRTSFQPLKKLEDMKSTIQAHYGLQPQQAQYVDAYGTLHCSPLVPCIAFENGDKNYFVSPTGDVFEVSSASKSMSHASMMQDHQKFAAVEGALSKNEVFISLAAEAWVVGSRVTPLH